MVKFLGLTGLAGCGKDTLALHLPYKNRAFADQLKAMACVFLNCNLKSLEYGKRNDLKVEGTDVTYCKVLQTLRTEWGRNLIDKDIWVKLIQKRIDNVEDRESIVIMDVRFDSEAKLILGMGDKIIKIIRPVPNKETKDTHVSEAGVSDRYINATLINDGSIGDMYRQFDVINANF